MFFGGSMKKTIAITGALLVAAALTACTTSSSPSAETTTAATATVAPSPTAPPTPEAMSVEEAGVYYLKTVCPTNAVADELNAAADTYDAATTKDLSVLTSVGAKARDAEQKAAKRFDDETVIWPSSVAKDIPVIRDSFFAEASRMAALATAKSESDIAAIDSPDNTVSQAASQRVRSRLNLSADTAASCKGY